VVIIKSGNAAYCAKLSEDLSRYSNNTESFFGLRKCPYSPLISGVPRISIWGYKFYSNYIFARLVKCVIILGLKSLYTPFRNG